MITLYTKPDCHACRLTKALLDRRGAEYRVIDLTAAPTAREKIAAWGYRSAPVVEAGPDRHWSGFRPDLLDEVLE